MANALYPKTKAKLEKAQLDLSSVTVKALLVASAWGRLRPCRMPHSASSRSTF